MYHKLTATVWYRFHWKIIHQATSLQIENSISFFFGSRESVRLHDLLVPRCILFLTDCPGWPFYYGMGIGYESDLMVRQSKHCFPDAIPTTFSPDDFTLTHPVTAPCPHRETTRAMSLPGLWPGIDSAKKGDTGRR